MFPPLRILMTDEIKFTTTELSNMLKLAALTVAIIVGVISFFVTRKEYNVLASEVKSTKCEQERKFDKMFGLMCQIGVKINGKEAVKEYCTKP